MKKSISVIAIILSMVMVLASCGTNQNGKDEEPVSTPDPELVKNTVNATIELEDGDEIMLELYPDLAPDTVENFVELAEDGFLKGEFAKNGFENTLSHTRGVISMARAQDYDSATSQEDESEGMDIFARPYRAYRDDLTHLYHRVIEETMIQGGGKR